MMMINKKVNKANLKYKLIHNPNNNNKKAQSQQS